MLREFYGMSARTATRIGVERRIKKRYRLSKHYEIFIRSVKSLVGVHVEVHVESRGWIAGG